MSKFELPYSIRVTNDNPDSDRQEVQTIVERDAFITDGRAWEGMDVWVRDNKLTYKLTDILIPLWEQIVVGLAGGPVGPDGPTGPTGPTGITGDTGLDGSDGTDGIDGLLGPVGPTGEQGEQGVIGQTGQDSTVPGPQGPAGPIGGVGPIGPQGPVGPIGPAGVGGAVMMGTVIGITGVLQIFYEDSNTWSVRRDSVGTYFLEKNGSDAINHFCSIIPSTFSGRTKPGYDIDTGRIRIWNTDTNAPEDENFSIIVFDPA